MSKVLIVDDNAMNRKLLRLSLQKEGFETIEAADGTEVLTRLQGSEVSALVSDILMPNMDGFRLCFEVRRREAWKTLPIVLYTATYTAKEDERLALEAGADRFYVKPDDLGKVITTVKELTSKAAESTARPPSKKADDSMRLYSEDLVRTLVERAESLSQMERQVRKVLGHVFQALNYAFRTLGRGAHSLLFNAGIEAGWNTYDYIKSGWLPDEDGTYVGPLADYLRLSGLCSEVHLHGDRSKGRIEASVVGGFEASLGERAREPTCHFLRGLLAGAGGRMFGLSQADCQETECQAMGKPRCHFVVGALDPRQLLR